MATSTFDPPPLSFSFPKPDAANNVDTDITAPLAALAPPPGLAFCVPPPYTRQSTSPWASDQQGVSSSNPCSYEPDFLYSRDRSTIISYDPKLNTDGEALHAFLLAQSSIPPRVLVHISGTHSETETRLVQGNPRENEVTSTEIRTEEQTNTIQVTDFKFSIDVTGSGYIARGPIQWTCADSDAAFRGGMVRQVDVGAGGEGGNAHVRRRKATHEESKKTREDEKTRKKGGLAPWLLNPKGALGRGHGLSPINEDVQGHFATPNASSQSLRDWTEEYATSSKRLKEFVFKKAIYGWDTNKLSESVKSAIHQQVGYHGNIVCTVTVTPEKICIRADNTFSRMMSSMICKILLSLVLVYPILWLVKRFGKTGGGKWKVAGVAYELGAQQWGGAVVGGGLGWDNGSMFSGGPGTRIGYYRGEEFFRDWESAIIRCAMGKVRSDEPLRWDRRDGGF